MTLGIDASKVATEYGIDIITSGVEKLEGRFDAVVLGVAHKEFKELDVRKLLVNECGVIYDVKGALDRNIVDGRL